MAWVLVVWILENRETQLASFSLPNESQIHSLRSKQAERESTQRQQAELRRQEAHLLNDTLSEIDNYIRSSELSRVCDRAEGARALTVNSILRKRYKIPEGVASIQRITKAVIVRSPTTNERQEFQQFIEKELVSLVFLSEDEKQKHIDKMTNKFIYPLAYKIVNLNITVDQNGSQHLLVDSYNSNKVMERNDEHGVFLSPEDECEVEDLGPSPKTYENRYIHLFTESSSIDN